MPKCSRQVEFKAASEQRLGRKKERQWKSGSRRGEDLLSMELGIVWKRSRERRKGKVKTLLLELLSSCERESLADDRCMYHAA